MLFAPSNGGANFFTMKKRHAGEPILQLFFFTNPLQLPNLACNIHYNRTQSVLYLNIREICLWILEISVHVEMGRRAKGLFPIPTHFLCSPRTLAMTLLRTFWAKFLHPRVYFLSVVFCRARFVWWIGRFVLQAIAGIVFARVLRRRCVRLFGPVVFALATRSICFSHDLSTNEILKWGP